MHSDCGRNYVLRPKEIAANRNIWSVVSGRCTHESKVGKYSQGSSWPTTTIYKAPEHNREDSLPHMQLRRSARSAKSAATAWLGTTVARDGCDTETCSPLPDSSCLFLDEHDLGERDGHAALLEGERQKTRCRGLIRSPVLRHLIECHILWRYLIVKTIIVMLFKNQ